MHPTANVVVCSHYYKNIILNIKIQFKKTSPMVHCDKLIEKKNPSKKVDDVREIIINIHT